MSWRTRELDRDMPYNEAVMRTLTLLLASLALCGCGKGRSYEGDWTFVDYGGTLSEATLTGSTVKITKRYPLFTFVQSGTYTSTPEYLSLNLNTYEVQDSRLTPEQEARLTNVGIRGVPYKVEWKSNDEFHASQIPAPGSPAFPMMTYKRKKD